MSEQERQQAIAKIEAQRYRKWFSWLILAPVLMCAGLTIFAPNINNMLARREANTVCADRVRDALQGQVLTTVYADDVGATLPVITQDNITQLEALGDTVIDDLSLAIARDFPDAVVHPQGDYTIYTDYEADEVSRFFVCSDDAEALGAFTADENARDVVFSAEGRQFVVSEGSFGRVMVFNGETVERAGTIALGEAVQIQSLAFHPIAPLLFITGDSTLFIYDMNELDLLHSTNIDETLPHELAFNAEGSKLFVIRSATAVPHARVWGIAN